MNLFIGTVLGLTLVVLLGFTFITIGLAITDKIAEGRVEWSIIGMVIVTTIITLLHISVIVLWFVHFV